MCMRGWPPPHPCSNGAGACPSLAIVAECLDRVEAFARGQRGGPRGLGALAQGARWHRQAAGALALGLADEEQRTALHRDDGTVIRADRREKVQIALVGLVEMVVQDVLEGGGQARSQGPA